MPGRIIMSPQQVHEMMNEEINAFCDRVVERAEEGNADPSVVVGCLIGALAARLLSVAAQGKMDAKSLTRLIEHGMSIHFGKSEEGSLQTSVEIGQK